MTIKFPDPIFHIPNSFCVNPEDNTRNLDPVPGRSIKKTLNLNAYKEHVAARRKTRRGLQA